MTDTSTTLTVNGGDAGAAALVLSAHLLQVLLSKGVLTTEDANALVKKAHDNLLKANSPGGAQALIQALGVKTVRPDAPI